MIREVIATGRDVNSAIDNGCTELGISRDDAQFEIISLPKKGFFGLKVYPAKVRIYQELPDPVVKPAPKPVPPRPAPQAARPAPQAAKPAPQATKAAPQAARPAPQATAAAAQPLQKSATSDKPQRTPRPPRPQPAAPAGEPAEGNYEPVLQVEIEPTPEVREKVEKAAVYLAEIMRAMGFETIEVTPAYYTENVCLRLSGAQLGVVIGRRGETLDALQYLTSLVANRGDGEYIRINIDSGNYREKREKTLTALARKLALQAVRTGKSTTLEPMNPYERRVIHGAVSQIRGAVSTSTGADPNRRVVISVADPAKRTGEAPLERSGHGGRGGSRGGKDSRDRGPRTPRSNVPLIPNTNKPFTPGAAPAEGEARPARVPAPRREPVALRPNTNVAASAAVAVNAPTPAATPVVTRLDDGTVGSTAVFGAHLEKPVSVPTPVAAVAAPPAPAAAVAAPPAPVAAVAAPPAPAVATAPASAPAPKGRKLSDAELFGDIPMGVPILSGDKPAAPKAAPKPEAKPAPKKLDGELYGKV